MAEQKLQEVKEKPTILADAAQMTALAAKSFMEAASSKDAPECKTHLETCNSVASTLICINHDIVGTKKWMQPFLQTATTTLLSLTGLMVMRMMVSETTCHGICSFHVHNSLHSLDQNYVMY